MSKSVMATASEGAFVLVTGASGYIATHVVKQLQEEGYRVRGTVRSLQDESKVKHLYNLCPDAKYKLELVEADLTKPETWEGAVQDAEYVIHVASPFPNATPRDETEVIRPAVDGTKHVLAACVAAKSVRRVVLTSSCAAISWLGPGDQNKVFTEEDWSNTDNLEPYAKSKTLAEKAAWEYINELPDADRIELAVINPAFVMGPVLHGTQGTSMEVVKRLLERAMPAIPRLNFPIVDVRDVAAAHVSAMVTPEAAGKRHVISGVNVWMKEMSQILAKEFKAQGGRHIVFGFSMWMRDLAVMLASEFDAQGYSVPTMTCPYFALWMTSLFDKTIKMILPQVGKIVTYDNSRMKDVLGVTPRDAKDTLIDMAYTMIENGFIRRAKKYRGPPGTSVDLNTEEQAGAKEENNTDKNEVQNEVTTKTEEQTVEVKSENAEGKDKQEENVESKEDVKDKVDEKKEEVKKEEKPEEKKIEERSENKEEKKEEKTENDELKKEENIEGKDEVKQTEEKSENVEENKVAGKTESEEKKEEEKVENEVKLENKEEVKVENEVKLENEEEEKVEINKEEEKVESNREEKVESNKEEEKVEKTENDTENEETTEGSKEEEVQNEENTQINKEEKVETEEKAENNITENGDKMENHEENKAEESKEEDNEKMNEEEQKGEGDVKAEEIKTSGLKSDVDTKQQGDLAGEQNNKEEITENK